MRRVGRVAPHNGHRNFTVLHETPAMHALHEAAATGAMRRFHPLTVGTRPRRVAMQAESAPHRLLGVIHWRRRGR
jgi:hypothetical protein